MRKHRKPFVNNRLVGTVDSGTAEKVSKLLTTIQNSKKLTVDVMCTQIGIGRTTFYRLRKERYLSNETLLLIKKWASELQ